MKIRHEINIINAQVGAGNTNECFYFDSSAYSGTLTFYVEAYLPFASSTTFAIQNTSTSTNYGSTTVSTVSLHRSSSFSSLPTGEYRFTSSGGVNWKSARLIIIQDTSSSDLTASQTQIEIGNKETNKSNTTGAALTVPKYWKYDSTAWDGTQSFLFEVVWQGIGTMYTLNFILQESDGTGDGFVNWSTKQTISVTTSASLTRSRSATFTPTNGRNYRLLTSISNSMETYNIYCAKIVVSQTSTITKLQEYYLMANTSFDSGTANQVCLTKWDSTEWDTTNTYRLAVDASNGNTSVVDVRTTGGTQISGSGVSSPDNQGIGSAFTMPSDQNLDIRATTNSGSLYAARLIVNAEKTSVPYVWSLSHASFFLS